MNNRWITVPMACALGMIFLTAGLSTTALSDDGLFIVSVNAKKISLYNSGLEEIKAMKKKEFVALFMQHDDGPDGKAALKVIAAQQLQGLAMLKIDAPNLGDDVWIEEGMVNLWPERQTVECPEGLKADTSVPTSGVTVGFGNDCS